MPLPSKSPQMDATTGMRKVTVDPKTIGILDEFVKNDVGQNGTQQWKNRYSKQKMGKAAVSTIWINCLKTADKSGNPTITKATTETVPEVGGWKNCFRVGIKAITENCLINKQAVKCIIAYATTPALYTNMENPINTYEQLTPPFKRGFKTSHTDEQGKDWCKQMRIPAVALSTCEFGQQNKRKGMPVVVSQQIEIYATNQWQPKQLELQMAAKQDRQWKFWKDAFQVSMIRERLIKMKELPKWCPIQWVAQLAHQFRFGWFMVPKDSSISTSVAHPYFLRFDRC